MDLRREDRKRIVQAPAKLNLFLDLLGRRDDGFHDVETLMVPVRLADTVSFTPIPAAECRVPGETTLNVVMATPLRERRPSAPIPTDADNLIVRGLRLLQARSGYDGGAQVELVKRVPAAAGLGGGSSDAAAALTLANQCWQIHWSHDRLAAVAAEIGSDVPFFLAKGAAICRGRGELVERLPPIAPLDVVIVKPPADLSTADVYRAYDALPEASARRTLRLADVLANIPFNRFARFSRHMWNSLQGAASSLSPWVERLRILFDELGFVGHQLSGSGSAYFGICRHAQQARRLANTLRTRQLGLVYATRTLG